MYFLHFVNLWIDRMVRTSNMCLCVHNANIFKDASGHSGVNVIIFILYSNKTKPTHKF